MRSAPIPCGTKPAARLVSGSLAHAPPSEPIGTWDMLSTPPTSISDSQPDAIFWAALFTASRPGAQNRFSCTPGTLCGKHGDTRDIGALVAHWRDTAQHHVVDPGRIKGRIPLLHGAQEPGRERDRLDTVQRAAPALSAGSTQRVVQEDVVWHCWPLASEWPAQTMAVTSTSTSSSGQARPETTTPVAAGRVRPVKFAPREVAMGSIRYRESVV